MVTINIQIYKGLRARTNKLSQRFLWKDIIIARRALKEKSNERG